MSAGRPSKLTPELTQRLTEELRRFRPVETACGIVGIGTTTFYRWMSENREFRDTIKRSQSEAQGRFIDLVVEQVAEHPVSLLWLGERLWPMTFSLVKRRLEADAIADVMSKLEVLPLELREQVANALEGRVQAGSVEPEGDTPQTEQ